MMQREVGEITVEIQSVGQLGGSGGTSEPLLCRAAFHVSGIMLGKGSGLESGFRGPWALLPSWPLPDEETVMTVLAQR